MIFRTNKEDKEKYFESPALNQSSLKKLLVGIDYFVEEEKETSYFNIGSAVDAILTGYEGQFEEEFYLASVPKPSETIEAMLLSIYDNCTDKKASLLDSIDLVEETVIAFNYQPKWKLETRVSKILEHALYYEEIQKMDGRKVLSPEEKNIVDTVVEELRTNSVSKDLFGGNYPSNVDVYFQLPLFWMEENTPCKGLIDMAVIERDEKGVGTKVHLFDLKTTSSRTLDFGNSFRKYRYDIQAAWYMMGIEKNREKFNLSKDYEIEFSFIVASTNIPVMPLLFHTSMEAIEIGWRGRGETYVGDALVKNSLKGIEQLLEIYRYQEQHGWDLDKVIKESDGVFYLNWDFLTYKTVDKDGTEVWKRV